jgi:glyoxylase-like metal-dependent hydrolase (beta-lactamase superfamily II)
MLGLEMPDVDVWSDRVVVALGQNPGTFTGPGTNSYLIGTGRERLLLDPGQGLPAYLPVLEQALERASCRIQAIVLTHGHPDHIGGVPSVLERFGPLEVSKRPWPGIDERHDVRLTPIDDGSVIRTEGAPCARSTRLGTPRTICALCSRRSRRCSRATTCSAWARPSSPSRRAICAST